MINHRKGFTFVELLIVLAIIAITSAMAIPIFTKQLEKSRETVDATNIRTQYTEVLSEAIMNEADVNVDGSEFGKIDLIQKESGWQNIESEKMVTRIATTIDGSPNVNGKAWVSISDGKVTIHFEDGGSGSGGGHSPMVSDALTKTKDDAASQILLDKIDDTLNTMISEYASLDIPLIAQNKRQNMVIFKVKVAADGSYTIGKANNNTVNLSNQAAAKDKEASKFVGSASDWSHDYYYVAVREDTEGNICATTNLAVKDGKIVTKQVNWRNYQNMTYETTGLDNPELISLTIRR